MSEPVALLVGGTKILEKALQTAVPAPVVIVGTMEEAMRVLTEKPVGLAVLGPTLRRSLAMVSTLRREGQTEPKLLVVYRDDQRDEVKRHQKGRAVADRYVVQSRIGKELAPAVAELWSNVGQPAVSGIVDDLEEIPLESLEEVPALSEAQTRLMDVIAIPDEDLPPPQPGEVLGAFDAHAFEQALEGEEVVEEITELDELEPLEDEPEIELAGLEEIESVEELTELEEVEELAVGDVVEELAAAELVEEAVPLEELVEELVEDVAEELIEDATEPMPGQPALVEAAAAEAAVEEIGAEEVVEELVAAEEVVEELIAAEEVVEELVAAEEVVEELVAAEEVVEELIAAEEVVEELVAAEEVVEELVAAEEVVEELIAAEEVVEELVTAEEVVEEVAAAPAPVAAAVAEPAPARASAPVPPVAAAETPANPPPTGRPSSGAHAMINDITGFFERLQQAAQSIEQLEAENQQLRDEVARIQASARPELLGEVQAVKSRLAELQLRLEGAEEARSAAVEARMKADLVAQRSDEELSRLRAELATAQSREAALESQLEARRHLGGEAAKSLRALAAALEG